MKVNKLLFLSIIFAACLSSIGADIYTPSLPAVAHNLNTTFSLAKWTMAIYMISIALSQLVYGPLSEGIGRKLPLIIGICIMIVGSIICVLAQTIDILLFGRFIQGCGAGACAALWRPVFRDMFSGDQLAKVSSYFGIFLIFIISAAPVIGGYLDHYAGWRSNFIFLAVYSFIALIFLVSCFKETSQHHHLKHLKLSYIVNNYKELLTHRLFVGLTLCSFLAYGGLFSWVTTGSILLIHGAGMTAISYGWTLTVGGGTAYLLSMQLNGRYVERFGVTNMLRFGISIMLAAGILMLSLSYMLGLNTWSVIIPALLFTFGVSFIFPNVFAKAFTPFGHNAGYAGALYGGIQVAGAGVLGGIVSHIPDHTATPLAVIFIITAILVFISYELANRKMHKR